MYIFNTHSEDGRVFIWGTIQYGSTSVYEKPKELLLSDKIVDVIAGVNYIILLSANGDIFSFGYNMVGQLADGTREKRVTPIRIRPSNEKVQAIICFNTVTTYVIYPSKIEIWGPIDSGFLNVAGDKGQLQKMSTDTFKSRVAKLYTSSENPYTILLTEDGRLYGTGDNTRGMIALVVINF